MDFRAVRAFTASMLILELSYSLWAIAKTIVKTTSTTDSIIRSSAEA